MNKVICDVCGTDYPETAAQCPICGCAKGDSGQTSAGNASEEEARNYTYVKGGRFSRSNVRKRLKAQAKQAAQREDEEQRKLVREDPKDLERFDDHEDEDDEDLDDDDDMEGVSNKGLILIVILLLLAIIAVSSYIVVTFFGGDDQPQNTRPEQTQQTTDATLPPETQPTESEPVVLGTPCTKLVLNDLSIELVKYMAPWELDLIVEPADTTDTVIFTSSDPSIVTVDDDGVIMGVGNGEATVTVSCGEFQAECKVVCQLLDIPTDATDETTDAPTEPTVTEPTVTEPVDPDLKLELNREDFTLRKKGESWQVHKGEVPRDQIQWSSDDETVATVVDGEVVAVGPGSTKIHAKYGDQEVTCVVRCDFPAETEPTDPTDPQPTEPTVTEPEDTQPVEPADLQLLVNGKKPKFSYDDKPNSADVSLVVGDDWRCVLSVDGAEDVKWTSGDSDVATVDADGTIVAKGAGQTTLKATVDGVDFIVMVRVKEE